MSDETSAAISAVRRDWVSEHRELYLKSGGREGHIMDITAVGGHSFATHCMIKYTGRKSGKTFITPLCYGDLGGEVMIVASKGGADTHPDWFLNVREMPSVQFQIGTQAFRGSYRILEGAEHEKAWAFMVDNFPFYANYQASTRRHIPIVAMKPIEAISVFKESDATGLRQ